MLKIIISKHAKRRLRKRLGISSGGQERHVYRAFVDGTTVQSLDDEQKMLVVYNRFYYIFALDPIKRQPVLLTVFPIPSRYLDAFDARLHLETLQEGRS